MTMIPLEQPLGMMFYKYAKLDKYGEFIGLCDDAPESVRIEYEKEVKRRKERDAKLGVIYV